MRPIYFSVFPLYLAFKSVIFSYMIKSVYSKENALFLQSNLSEPFFNSTSANDQIRINNSNNQTMGELEFQTYNISFWLENDYDKVVGLNKSEFQYNLLYQMQRYEESFKLSREINSSKVYIERLIIWPKRKLGRQRQSKNILVTATLIKITDEEKVFIDDFLLYLDQLLHDGHLNLTDLNNNTLSIPKQRMEITVTGKIDDPVNSWLILGIFLGMIFIALVFAIHKHRKEKADSVRPIQNLDFGQFRIPEVSVISRLRVQLPDFSDNLNEDAVSTRASSATTLSVIAVSLSDIGESMLSSSPETNSIRSTGRRNIGNEIFESSVM